MIFDQLTLRNFCLYHGEQTFNLAPAQRAGKSTPVILFGGLNGGGKTTLLDAVQLVLYGVRARCSKRNDKPYEEFLRESIHHDADPRDGAAVELSFRYASEGREHLYQVTRSWCAAGERIRETVQVYRDGEIDTWLSDNWNQMVEELIPFGIAQLCFFDAEKIRFLAEDETSSEALGSAVKSLLGLDLVERLVTDASVLESRIAKRAKKSADSQEAERLEEQLTAKQKDIERAVQERGTLQNAREAAERRMQDAETRFAKIGGQHWEQRAARQKQLGEVEQSVKEHEERLVELSATELPLALIPGLLCNAAKQAELEHRACDAEVIAILIDERDASLLKALSNHGLDAATIKFAKQFLAQDRTERASCRNLEARLQLSESARRLLDYLLDRGITERVSATAEIVEKVEIGQRSLEDLQRSLAATPQDDTVIEVVESLKNASRELAPLDQQIKRLDGELEALRNDREVLTTQITKLRRKVVDEDIRGEEDSRLASRLIRTQETMKEFLRRGTARKIDRLSELVTESFRFLLRKQTLVQRVQIDPNSFTITLYDNNSRPIAKQRLSEGEKQIFAISVLWGLSRAAGRQLPVIIDTPMGRLDSKHRDHFVQRYFPNASHQVLVLSTDTEIEQQYFDALQPFITRAYHLDYDEERKVTIGREGYFWKSKKELEEATA